MDAFESSLKEPEAPDGPFRTAEPTPEVRLARAREASWERVDEATRAQIAREERARIRWDRAVWALLGLSILALAGLGAAMALGEAQLGALLCPAISFVIASALGLAYRLRV